MPQFDFTTYPSQIFWFLICFSALYSAMHFIVLPRIRIIINQREKLVTSDNLSAAKLEKKINEIKMKTENLRKDANEKYQNNLEEILHQSAKKREKAIEEMKEKIDLMTKKSRKDLHDFVQVSQVKSFAAIQNLIQNIKAKIFN
jgi:F-type H+-transporting ATPase subunit b